MAFTLSQIKNDKFIEVILPMDDALDVTETEYAQYLSTLDESLLKMKSDAYPTRFIMRRILPYKLTQAIENKKISINRDGETSINMGFTTEMVRASLVDIKYHESVPVEDRIRVTRTGDDLVTLDLMEKLMAAGIVETLFAARQNALSHNDASLKKSSQPSLNLASPT